MKIHLLTGFLGSGKTTAIQHAVLGLLHEGERVAVITNDQGTRLVDGDLFKALNIPERQVVNGCFCCNYNELDAGIQSLIETNSTEIIFAESVGSCTDIVATVLKPLLQFRPDALVTVSTFADIRLMQMMLAGNSSFDDSVSYIYLKQLEEAGIIVVNKIDLVSEQELAAVKQLMQEKYGNKVLIYQHSLDEESIKKWLNTLDNYQSSASLQSLSIDYDIYAEGESNMAWFDQDLEIYSSADSAFRQAEALINRIYKKIIEQKYSIGHLKFFINGTRKISFTSNNEPPIRLKWGPAMMTTLLINIRIQETPETISALVKDAIQETELQSDCKIIESNPAAFKPGYPRPVFRL